MEKTFQVIQSLDEGKVRRDEIVCSMSHNQSGQGQGQTPGLRVPRHVTSRHGTLHDLSGVSLCSLQRDKGCGTRPGRSRSGSGSGQSRPLCSFPCSAPPSTASLSAFPTGALAIHPYPPPRPEATLEAGVTGATASGQAVHRTSCSMCCRKPHSLGFLDLPQVHPHPTPQ